MSNGLQINLHVIRVSRLFASNPAKPRCGDDVAKSLGIKPSTTYSLLERLERAAWLKSALEHERWSASEGLVPSRASSKRLYEITNKGLAAASQIMTALQMAST